MKVKIENIVEYSIISFGLLPILPNKIKGILLVLFFIISFKYFLRNKSEYYLKFFLINSFLFFIYLISVFYSSDLSNAFRKLGPALSIIIFPLLFFVFLAKFKIKRSLIYSTLNLLSISTILFLIVYFVYLFYAPHPTNPALDYPSTFFFRRTLLHMPLWEIHPIYLSLFIAISIINLFRISLLTIKTNNKFFISSILSQLLLLSTFFILSTKAAILFLVLSGVIVVSIYSKKKFQTFLIAIPLLFVFFLLIFSIPQSRSRFKELLNPKTYSKGNLDYRNSTQIRIVIWDTALEKIKEAPIFGYGIGDIKYILHQSYKKKSPVLIKKNYNSHNQYLGVWLSVGIVGLLFFLYFLYINFKLAIKHKDYLFLIILFFFSFNFLTENIIERQLGGMFFFFLINLFGSYNIKKSINNS